MLLPGASRLARLVGSVREAANQRLWDTLYGMLSVGQRAVLDSLLTVPPGERVSELDRLRRGPVRVSGPQMKRALWNIKMNEDVLLVHGVKRGWRTAREIQVQRMWVLEP